MYTLMQILVMRKLQKKFSELSHAYEILADNEKRKNYDSYGHNAEQMDNGMPQGFTNAEDLFRDLFGGRGGSRHPFADLFGNMGNTENMGHNTGNRQQPQRGADFETSLRISFMEAVKGCKHEIQVQTQNKCDTCDGSGIAAGTQPIACQGCGGQGMRTQSSGFFHIQTTCPDCNGQGVFLQKCTPCYGNGLVSEPRSITVSIPAGVDNGTRLRLVNQGDAGRFGGDRGHLWLILSVDKHSTFTRDGVDVHVTIPINISKAILGGSIPVPTLDETDVKLKLHPGIQPGDKRVMRGKGISHIGKDIFGDQYVHIQVCVPRNLTSFQQDLIKKFDASFESEKTSNTKKDEKVENEKEKNDKESEDDNKGFFSRFFS